MEHTHVSNVRSFNPPLTSFSNDLWIGTIKFRSFKCSEFNPVDKAIQFVRIDSI